MSLDSFIRFSDKIVEFDWDISDNILPVSSTYSVNIHIDEIKSTWERVKSEYENYIREKASESNQTDDSDADEEASELENNRAKYKTTYITYCRCLSLLSRILDDLRVFRSLQVLVMCFIQKLCL